MTHTSEKDPSSDTDKDLQSIEPMLTYEEQLEQQLENTVRTIYFYQQSYLVDWIR